MHVLPDSTRSAGAARDDGMEEDLLAFLHCGDRGTDLLHEPCVLVAQGVRERDLDFFLPDALDDVQIRVADARACDAHEHVRRILEPRGFDVYEFERFVICEKSGRLHEIMNRVQSIRALRTDGDRIAAYRRALGGIVNSLHPATNRLGTLRLRFGRYGDGG